MLEDVTHRMMPLGQCELVHSSVYIYNQKNAIIICCGAFETIYVYILKIEITAAVTHRMPLSTPLSLYIYIIIYIVIMCTSEAPHSDVLLIDQSAAHPRCPHQLSIPGSLSPIN